MLTNSNQYKEYYTNLFISYPMGFLSCIRLQIIFSYRFSFLLYYCSHENQDRITITIFNHFQWSATLVISIPWTFVFSNIWHILSLTKTQRYTKPSNFAVSKCCLLGYKLLDKTRQIPLCKAKLVILNCQIFWQESGI